MSKNFKISSSGFESVNSKILPSVSLNYSIGGFECQIPTKGILLKYFKSYKGL